MTAHGRKLLIGATALLALSATVSGPARAADTDPYEQTNRAIHEFNMDVDRVFLKPVAKGYRAITPKPVRKGVTNFLNNLREPFTFINALLQFKPDVAANALGRFIINTTVGIAGLTDPATKLGVKEQREDFGQTLAVWGVPEGPYLVLPFLGPSNPRDFIGDVVQFFGDPASIFIEKEISKKAYYGTFAARIIDMRSNAIDTIDPLLKTADDPYVFIRSAYRQNRAFAISDGAIAPPSDEDDIFGDDIDDSNPSDALAPAESDEAQTVFVLPPSAPAAAEESGSVILAALASAPEAPATPEPSPEPVPADSF